MANNSASLNTSRSRENTKPSTLHYQPPKHAFWGPAFKVLCIIAISRDNLEHWGMRKGWKEHSKAIINRFHNRNLTAGLVLTTTAVLLTSHPALALLMDYDSPSSYSFAIAAFSAALLSVISGTAVLAMYQTCTAHHNMQALTKLTRWQVILLLSVFAWPSVCLAAATLFMYMSILIACFRTGDIIAQVIMALSFSAFFINGVFMLHVFINIGRKLGFASEPEQYV